MHNDYRRVALIGLLGFSLACSDQPLAPDPAPGVDATYLQALEAMGFHADSVKDLGATLLVEGDIEIAKSVLTFSAKEARKSIGASPDTIHRKLQWANMNGQPVSPDRATNITVNLTGIYSDAGWTEAARLALGVWSSVTRTDLHLSEGSVADITVQFGDCPGCVARAGFPSGVGPAPNITISHVYDYYTVAQKEEVLVHELGHTLGMRHADWQSIGEAQNGAWLLALTPQLDPGSVMIHDIGGIAWSGFDSYDIRAVRDLYPFRVAGLAESGGNLSWQSAPEADYYDVVLYEDVWDEAQDGSWYTHPSSSNLAQTSSTSTPALYHTGLSWCFAMYGVQPHYPDGTVGGWRYLDAGDVCPDEPF